MTAAPRPRAARLRALLRAAWRWSPLLTVPAVALLVALGVRAWDRYERAGLQWYWVYDAADASPLKRALEHAAWELRADARRLLGRTDGDADLRLALPRRSLRKLEEALPDSGFTYREGTLTLPDGTDRPVQVRYRGDSQFHWFYPPRSYRVKTRKREPLDGIRTFNLEITKGYGETFSNHAAYLLARHLGVPAPPTRVVRLGVNGRDAGLRLLVPQTNRQLLALLGLPPGDLYVGDASGLKEATWLGLHDMFEPDAATLPYVFQGAWMWEKRAYGGLGGDGDVAPLRRLLAALADPDGDLSLLDLDAFAHFSALRTLAQTGHVGRQHNWKLHFDPAAGVFRPLAWDPLGWFPRYLPDRLDDQDLDPADTVLWARLMADVRFQDARHEALLAFLAGGREPFLAELERDVAATLDGLPATTGFFDVAGRHLDHAALRAAIAAFPGHVRAALAALERSLLDAPRGLHLDRVPGGVRLCLVGPLPARRLRVRLREPLAAAPPVTLRYAVARPGGAPELVSRDVSAAARVEDGALVLDVPLWFDLALERPDRPSGDRYLRRVRRVPGCYELLPGGDAGDAVEGVVAELRGRGPVPVEAQVVHGLELAPFRGLRDPLPPPRPAPRTWRGEVRLTADTTVREDLRLEPGTTVRLGPGVLLELLGRVEAAGTAAAPVRFLPLDPAASFGAVLLRGPGASGSTLRHVEVAGGAGAVRETVRATGSLSVHAADGVRLEACTLRDNAGSDDLLHAVGAGLTVDGCRFERAGADALDADLSRVAVLRSTFVASGNDALDVMGGEAFVGGCRVLGAGDKAASLGERARVLVADGAFEGAWIGIGAKDGAEVAVVSATVRGCEVAADARRKSWRYDDGARLGLLGVRLDGNLHERATSGAGSAVVVEAPAAGAPRPFCAFEPTLPADAPWSTPFVQAAARAWCGR